LLNIEHSVGRRRRAFLPAVLPRLAPAVLRGAEITGPRFSVGGFTAGSTTSGQGTSGQASAKLSRAIRSAP